MEFKARKEILLSLLPADIVEFVILPYFQPDPKEVREWMSTCMWDLHYFPSPGHYMSDYNYDRYSITLWRMNILQSLSKLKSHGVSVRNRNQPVSIYASNSRLGYWITNAKRRHYTFTKEKEDALLLKNGMNKFYKV